MSQQPKCAKCGLPLILAATQVWICSKCGYEGPKQLTE
jgi:ribosomal protein L37AE/L43A